ncbi:MAG TPA: hypothetical protein VOA87_12785 [Thermoanaerobaculia bacterium]|nr:hypothetical protein [Thermoanaerobaculia bacterium]
MSTSPEERRIAAALRERIAQHGTTVEAVESRLGWQPGRLQALLEGETQLAFGDLLEVLPAVGSHPASFFALLYGFDLKGDADPRKARDRRFERSERVVKEAIARRNAWKKEREKPER